MRLLPPRLLLLAPILLTGAATQAPATGMVSGIDNVRITWRMSR